VDVLTFWENIKNIFKAVKHENLWKKGFALFPVVPQRVD